MPLLSALRIKETLHSRHDSLIEFPHSLTWPHCSSNPPETLHKFEATSLTQSVCGGMKTSNISDQYHSSLASAVSLCFTLMVSFELEMFLSVSVSVPVLTDIMRELQ